MAQTTIHIDGMTCGHCANWVSEALKKLDGVTSVSVSVGEKNALVEHDEEKVTEEMMVSAVEQAGYSVKSFE
ncbi:hypothetical protein MNBD_NITROSPINAE01-51 [hydrothermal vent metagenome]|uniref:HMA domain-containing protein n=1 Tax=hydrothermal vent metagenome TaxID=652676 RepID=A0A3B1C8E8_9ZZZZ